MGVVYELSIKFMHEDKTAEENGSNYCPLQSCKVDTSSHRQASQVRMTPGEGRDGGSKTER